MFKSMRNKIITAFIIVTTVPLILLAFFVYREMEKTLENEIREGTSKEMLQMDHALVTMLKGMKEDCQYLATNPFVEMVDTVDVFYNIEPQFVPPGNDSVHERIYRELERYAQQHPETAYAYLGTENGGFIGWPRRAAQKGLDPRKRPWYRPAIENQEETFLSEPYETFDGSKFTVTASHFVRNFDGTVIGVLGVDISLDQFTRKISELKIGDTGYVFMLAKDGTIMAHPNPQFLGHKISQLASSKMLNQKDSQVSWDFPEYQRLVGSANTYFETTIEGQRCFVNMQTSSMKNWSLVTVVSADEIAGRAKKISIPLVVGTIVLVIIIVPLVSMVSYRLTLRMDELVRHLNHMASGDFSERLPEKLLSSRDEIGEVAQAIDFMQVSRQQAEWELQASNEELAATYGQLAAAEAELREQLEQLNLKTQELAQSEERYRLVAAGSKDAIWDWNITGRTVALLGQWADSLHFSHMFTDCDIFDQRIVSKIHADDLDKRHQCLQDHLAGETPEYICEYRIITQEGETVWVLGRGKALFDAEGNPIRMAGSMTDITQTKMQNMKIQHLAYHDALTGLPNRLAFLEKLSAELNEENKYAKGALLFMDLDNFKMINDSMGHAVGDQFLMQTADALKKVAQEQFVARLGGDEFIVILFGESDRQIISGFAQKLIQAVSEVCISTHDPLAVTLSIGIALYPDDGLDTKSLLKNADIAMQCAKNQGKHRFEFFTTAMEIDIIHKMQLEAGLRKALKNGEFVLYYQPIVNVDKQLVAFEALIRWQSPEYGLVSPAQFIPVAEESNLIVEIGEWVLHTACLFGKRLHEAGLTGVHLSVNVSVKEWLQEDFTDKVASTLEKTAFPKDCLTLEIVETMLIENFKDVTGKIYDLKKLGVSISLDDFGTGYSSLTYLSELPVNTIKIDKSFVDALLEKSNYAAIVGTVIQLAHEMGFDVVAEGVETREQMLFLQELKCDRMQGYFISKPLPEETIWEKYC
jgi:diguanylate cyclase (GGDEF)-like protein/PAS domain S-box-containing protein